MTLNYQNKIKKISVNNTIKLFSNIHLLKKIIKLYNKII